MRQDFSLLPLAHDETNITIADEWECSRAIRTVMMVHKGQTYRWFFWMLWRDAKCKEHQLELNCSTVSMDVRWLGNIWWVFFFLFFFKSVLANFIQFQTLVSISLEELCVQMLHSELGAVWHCKARCQFNIWKPVQKEQSRFLACSSAACLLG